MSFNFYLNAVKEFLTSKFWNPHVHYKALNMLLSFLKPVLLHTNIMFHMLYPIKYLIWFDQYVKANSMRINVKHSPYAHSKMLKNITEFLLYGHVCKPKHVKIQDREKFVNRNIFKSLFLRIMFCYSFLCKLIQYWKFC